jgi:tripartite-type tricarboxylate transporter receptor subunit TctC
MSVGTVGQWLLRLLAGVAAALLAVPAAGWSDRPVRFIVPAPPGGTADAAARIVAERISASIRQPVIVENKPGGGGAIAIHALVSAPADGQALFVGAQNVLTEVPLVLKVGFDPFKDLKPVAEMARSSLVLISHPGFNADTLQELIAFAKSNPGRVTYASYSAGTVSHYAGLLLNKNAGSDLLHIPYKGSPPALQDVAGGRVPLMFDGLVTSLPLIKSGKLKALAIASRVRADLLPQVPTFVELGYPDLEFGNWIGAIASAKMSPELIARINSEIVKTVASQDVRSRLAGLGFEQSPPSTPAQLDRSVRSDYERNAGIVKAFNIKFE